MADFPEKVAELHNPNSQGTLGGENHADIEKRQNEEIIAIETNLGKDGVAGSKANLKERLAVSINEDGTLKTSGTTGPTGPIGPTGPQGSTGPSGIDGSTGPTGNKGDKGDTGANSIVPGPTGPQGKDGLNGKDGTNGIDGIGIKGDKGDNGNDGYTPIKGVDYFDGTNGIDGKDGKDGLTGLTGPQGNPGPQGPAFMSKCRVYLTTPQTIPYPPSEYTPLRLTGINFDILGEWDSVNYKFIAKESGYYLVHGSCRMSQYSGSMNMSAITVNSVVKAKQRVLRTSVINNSVPTDLVFLNVGDFIQLTAYVTINNTVINEGSDETWLFIHRLS